MLGKRLTVQEAAERLQCSPLTIRCGMVEGTLQIGKVVHSGKKKKTYLIYESLIEKFLKGG